MTILILKLRFNANKIKETYILLSLLRRIGKNAPEGVSIKCYAYQTKNKTTLTVSDNDISKQALEVNNER